MSADETVGLTRDDLESDPPQGYLDSLREEAQPNSAGVIELFDAQHEMRIRFDVEGMTFFDPGGAPRVRFPNDGSGVERFRRGKWRRAWWSR